MRPSEFSHFLALCYAAKEPTYVSAKPGCGKTQIHYGVAKALGIGFMTHRAPLLGEIDCRGLPDLQADNTVWKRPSILPPLNNGTTTKGLFFIDELVTAVPAVQATLYELFETRPDGTRWIAGHKMPDGWLPCAAGNRLSDKAIAHKIPTPLISRFAMVEMENTNQDFIDWCIGGEAKPVPNYLTGDDGYIEPEIIAFNKNFPGHQNNFDAAKMKDNEPYACERSWHRASNFLKVCKKNNLGYEPDSNNPDRPYITLEMLTAFLGKGVASEFIAFQELWDKVPTREEILLNPTTCKIPAQPSFKCAVSAMLGRVMNKTNIENVLRYITRQEFGKPFEVLTIQTALSISKDLTQSKPFMRWAKDNQGVVL